MNGTQFSLGYPKSLTKKETNRQKSNTLNEFKTIEISLINKKNE